MKRENILYSICALTMVGLCSCSDFLDKEPQDTMVNDTYWQTESSLRTYAQGFYSTYFTGYGTDYYIFGGYFSGDNFTDDFLITNTNAGELYFPTSATTDINADTDTWEDNYAIIYKANVMIEKIPDMDLDDETKAHWLGVARYFRAMAYSALTKIYGGVPYISASIELEDAATLYKDRDSYLTVAKNILEDYEYALANVRTDDDKLQVNRYVVGAYMSRDMLYHATWLKYHGTTVGPTSEAVSNSDISALLQGAIDGAQVVMNSGEYSIGNTYNALFSVDDLADNPEIIFYREYVSGVQCNPLMSYNAGENQIQGGITQDAVESYLCQDGLPIGQSSTYQTNVGGDPANGGDPSVLNSLKERDPRLYQTIADTIRVMGVSGTDYEAGASPTAYATKKFLNDEWFAEESSYCTNNLSPADGPCIRYAEVLLNYVEARYEISQVGGDAFSQNDLDLTINKLRARSLTKYGADTAETMPSVTLAGSNLSSNGITIDDPARDTDVAPILWEIRRERRVELMMEGRRGEDLRRWAKYEYLNSEDESGNPDKTFLGAYFKKSTYPKMTGATLYDPADPTNADPDKGYFMYNYETNMRVFVKGELSSERYYLRAIPAEQITIYSDNGYTLTQNPGW